MKKFRGAEHPSVASALNNLAQLLQDLVGLESTWCFSIYDGYRVVGETKKGRVTNERGAEDPQEIVR